MKNSTTILPALLLIASFTANAQSLPSVQKISVRAPANIKIDGKATEWDDKFQAYNHATDVFYTLSNDDENLYLTVKATDHFIADKILRGGITLVINHTLTKKDNTAVSVTYPVLRNADMSAVTNLFSQKGNEKRDANGAAIQPDDLNKALESKSKLININGIKVIADDAISVYNEQGIKAVSLFDKDLAYTYELAIPLKYLELPNNGADGFSYSLIIHEPAASHYVPGGGPPGPPMPLATAGGPTDFWGEYTLAKK